jgi:BirA family biotin operon repressor/biotin-[acetyl-CoA-carboxylase] ligase
VTGSLSALLGPDYPEATIVDETGSTNEDLRERARRGAPPWTVRVARRQTAGRGRHGREWVSGEGDLCFSVLLRPDPAWAGLLPLAAGLGVADMLESLQLSPRLKWPNDVLVGERKIAGILAEGLSTGGNLEAVVLGIGLNLRLDPAKVGGALVTSVLAETGSAPEVLEAAAAVLRHLRLCYDALSLGGAAATLASFRARSLPWWGTTVEVVSGGERIVGRAHGLDPQGALILERADGTLLTLLSGEARQLRRQEA